MTIWLLACVLASSQAGGARSQEPPPGDRPAVELRLRCLAEPCRFRQGEVISLELAFTSSVPRQYQINLATYDRVGRMHYEEFAVTPRTGTRDPLASYFGGAGASMGGLTTYRLLSETPATIRLDLNEWIAFDLPGRYQLQVTSRRVDDVNAGTAQLPFGALRTSSNEITIEILTADADWQAAELERILRVLDSGGPDEDSRRQAARRLRFLGSEAAVRELARRLRGEGANESDLAFGLIGSLHRTAVVAAMTSLLADPDFPVTGHFLSTLATAMQDDTSAAPHLQRQNNLFDLRLKLMDVVQRKRGKAQAVSTHTALEGISEQMPVGMRSNLIAKLMSSFDELPIESQITWLHYRWKEVGGTEWTSILREHATRYEDFPELREFKAAQSLQLSAVALQRWYELDPAGARAAVIAEITRRRPRYGASVLGLLPDRILANEARTVADNLLSADDLEIESNLASLLDRYGDKEVLPAVLAKLERRIGVYACTPQNTLLAFVMKVDPETAKPLIERAIEARGSGHSACRHSIFTDLGRRAGSVLEELAVASLDDTDPQVAANAARYLGEHGSAKSQHPLWRRYEAWSLHWRGRENELRSVLGEENPNVWEAALGQALATALATGRGWAADEEMLRHILELTVGQNMRRLVESAISAGRTNSR